MAVELPRLTVELATELAAELTAVSEMVML